VTETSTRRPEPGHSPGRPEAIKAIPVRHYGRYVSAVIAIGILVAIVYAFGQGKINWHAVPDYFFDHRIMTGVYKTMLLTVLSMVIGIVGGIGLAVMRLSKNPVTSSIAWFYIWFFRGTPVLVQLFLWFNLGLVFEYINLGPIYKNYWSDFMTPLLTALLGLGLNEAAYMAEICRAGLLVGRRGPDRGLARAGHEPRQDAAPDRDPAGDARDRAAHGQRGHQHAEDDLARGGRPVSRTLPNAQDIGQNSGAPVEMYFLAASWYLIMTSVLSVGQYYVERYYARGSSRALPNTPYQKIKANMLSIGRPKGGAA
jgi:polar amino acid transport system permease protein